MRFNDDYPRLRPPGLDGDRLELYRPALYLSLVAGPLRLLDGDFPDRAFMRAIAEGNTRRALAVLGTDPDAAGPVTPRRAGSR